MQERGGGCFAGRGGGAGGLERGRWGAGAAECMAAPHDDMPVHRRLLVANLSWSQIKLSHVAWLAGGSSRRTKLLGRCWDQAKTPPAGRRPQQSCWGAGGGSQPAPVLVRSCAGTASRADCALRRVAPGMAQYNRAPDRTNRRNGTGRGWGGGARLSGRTCAGHQAVSRGVQPRKAHARRQGDQGVQGWRGLRCPCKGAQPNPCREAAAVRPGATQRQHGRGWPISAACPSVQLQHGLLPPALGAQTGVGVNARRSTVRLTLEAQRLHPRPPATHPQAPVPARRSCAGPPGPCGPGPGPAAAAAPGAPTSGSSRWEPRGAPCTAARGGVPLGGCQCAAHAPLLLMRWLVPGSVGSCRVREGGPPAPWARVVASRSTPEHRVVAVCSQDAQARPRRGHRHVAAPAPARPAALNGPHAAAAWGQGDVQGLSRAQDADLQAAAGGGWRARLAGLCCRGAVGAHATSSAALQQPRRRSATC